MCRIVSKRAKIFILYVKDVIDMLLKVHTSVDLREYISSYNLSENSIVLIHTTLKHFLIKSFLTNKGSLAVPITSAY